MTSDVEIDYSAGTDFFSDVPFDEPQVEVAPTVDAGDFFSDVPFDVPSTEIVYDEQSERAIKAPAGLGGDEILYHDGIQNNQKARGQYLSYTDIGVNTVTNIAKSYMSGVTSIGKRFAEFDVQTAELGIQSAAEREDLQVTDLFTALLPTGKGKIAGARVSEFFGDEGAVEEEVEKLKGIRDAGLAALKSHSSVLEGMGLKKIEGSVISDVGWDFGGGLQSMVSFMGASAMFKNPAAYFQYLVEEQRGGMYIEARDAGLSIADADLSAEVRANTSALFNMVGFGLLSKWSLTSTGSKRFVGGAVNELIEEGAETIVDVELSEYFDVTNMTGLEKERLVIYNAFIGFLIGGPTSVIIGSTNTEAKKLGVSQEVADKAVAYMEKHAAEIDSLADELVASEASNLSESKEDVAQSVKMLEDFANGIEVDGTGIPQDTTTPPKKPTKDVDPISALNDKLTELETEIELVKDSPEKTQLLEIEKQEIIGELEEKAASADTEVEQARQLIQERVSEVSGVQSDKIDAQIVKARQKSIKKELAALNKEVASLSKEINSNIEQGKSVKKQEARVEKILNERDLLQAERENLSDPELISALNLVDIAAKRDITLAGSKLKRLNVKITKDTIKLVDSVINKIQVATKKDIKNVQKEMDVAQKEIRGVVNELEISPKDKKELLNVVDDAFKGKAKNVQDARQLTKELGKISKLINKNINKQRTKQISKSLKSVLGKTKAKVESGRKKGKFDAEIQARLDDLRDISQLKLGRDKGGKPKKVTVEEAKAVLGQWRFQKSLDPDSVDSLDIDVLALSVDPTSVDTDRASDILLEVSEVIDTGRIAGRIREFKSIKRSAENRKIADDVFTEKPLVKVKGVKGKLQNALANARAYTSAVANDWMGTMDLVTGFGSKKSANAFKERLDVFESEKAEREGLAQKSEEYMSGIVRAITGEGDVLTKTKTGKRQYKKGYEKRAWKKIQDDVNPDKTTVIGTNVRGEIIELTRAEMRTAYMMLQREVSEYTMMHENGNGWTPEMVETLTGELFSNEADVAILEETREFFDAYYEINAAAYADKTGTPLDKDKHYFPIRRDLEKNVEFDDFANELNYTEPLKAAAFKNVSKNIRPIKLTNDIDVVQSHINEMEHFRAWYKKLQDIQDVIGDAQFQKNVRDTYGEVMLDNINSLVGNFISGGSKRSDTWMNIVTKLRTNFSGAVLGPRPSLVIKQQISYFAYAHHIPTKHLISGTADFFSDVEGNLKILNESSFFRGRGGASMDRDIKDFVKSGKYSLFVKNPTFWNQLNFGATAKGDKAVIAYGGWAVYKYNKDVLGKSKKESLEVFERASKESQQSSDLSNLSVMQQGNPLAKLFTMFTNAPLQYTRLISNSVRQYKRGRIDFDEMAKAVFIYQFLLPMLWQFVGDLGRFDPQHQARAALSGPWNSLFILGDVIDAMAKTGTKYVAKKITGEKQDDKFFPVGDNSTEFIVKLERAMSKLSKDDISMEDVLDAVSTGAEGVGLAIGKPIGPILQIGDGINTLVTDDAEAGIYKMLGFPDSAVEKHTKDDKKKASF